MVLSASERKRIAADVGVNEQYLYQCLTGRRDMNPAEARRIEADTGGALRRWDLCQKSWALIWPELKGDPEAPGASREPGRASPCAGAVSDGRAPTAGANVQAQPTHRGEPERAACDAKAAPHTERAQSGLERRNRKQLRLPFNGRRKRDGEGGA
jgi:DNA-binding transcriptional regulator YdaS (Cro superfamily)